MKKPVRVTVTGAAGQIGYALLFRIAAGDMLGKDQPIILKLLEIPQAMKAVDGVMMELRDCAFPLLHGLEASDDPSVAFEDTEYALLVGSRPRGPGMERKDLLQANGAIFTTQGKALNARAARNVRVLVVGNPANTNCLIAMRNAPDLDPSQFTSMTRLDHNRASSLLAEKTGALVARRLICEVEIAVHAEAIKFAQVGVAVAGRENVASVCINAIIGWVNRGVGGVDTLGIFQARRTPEAECVVRA